jgi:hypothetical protein
VSSVGYRLMFQMVAKIVDGSYVIYQDTCLNHNNERTTVMRTLENERGGALKGGSALSSSR